MKVLLSLTGISLFWLVSGATSLAHQSQIAVERLATVKITATYGGHQPMRQAQVSVYGPDDPQTPWQMGQTDDQGQYRFVPDQTGDWEVKVRQAGHGIVTQIPVTQESAVITTAAQNSTEHHPTEPEQSPLRQGVMILSVLWGFVGTAFFFSRKVQSHPPS